MWKKTHHRIFDGQRNIKAKGFENGPFLVARVRPDFWLIFFIPSGESIAISSDTKDFCQRSVEYLLGSGINWNAPSIADVMKNHGISWEGRRQLMQDAAIAATGGDNARDRLVSARHQNDGSCTITVRVPGGEVEKSWEEENGSQLNWPPLLVDGEAVVTKSIGIPPQ